MAFFNKVERKFISLYKLVSIKNIIKRMLHTGLCILKYLFHKEILRKYKKIYFLTEKNVGFYYKYKNNKVFSR